jgi:type IV pilus assembly protein PilY1
MMRCLERFFLILVGVTLTLTPRSGLTQSEIPVLVKAPNAAKIMLLVDDSGSMNAVIEHPDFSPTSACSADTSKALPSVIFKLLSGSASPASTQLLQPMLIEVNAGFYGATSSNSIYTSRALNSPTSFPFINAMTCNNSSGNATCCSGTSGSSCPTTGINTGSLYGNAGVTGSNVFQVSNLTANSGSYVTDSSGNEYLYLRYRQNTYENGYNNWNDVWASFNASNTLLDNFTTAYTSPGGTVVFNSRQVFLSQGWYRREYLRWIFYCATEEQRAALPGATRIQSVKDVMTSLISTNTSVNFGIATLNGATFTAGTSSGNIYSQWYAPQGNYSTCGRGRIRRPIGTTTATLLSEIPTLTGGGGTPLTSTYIEALRYFGGASDTDSCTSSTSNYTSPITGQCDAHVIVMLTDGLPSSESIKRWPNGSYPSNVDSNSNPVSSMGSCSSSSSTCISSFLSDSSWWAYHTDIRSTVAGVQNISSYAVAFGVPSYPLLDRYAQAGGTGSAFVPSTTNELAAALQDIINVVFQIPTSGAGVATLEKLYGETRVYQPVFYADNWVGRIQVFNYNAASDALEFLFDIADLLDERDLSTQPRRIIAGYDSNFDGRTNQTVGFDTVNAANLRPQLFRFYDTAQLSSTLLPAPLTAYTETAAASTLISYITGTDISGMRVRDRNADNRADRLGDIVYSKPVEVGAKNGNFSALTGYNAFVASLQNEPRILLAGANDGMLHAFDSTSGEELWAYIPSSQLPFLERLGRPSYVTQSRRAFVDGPITVEDVYRNGQWRTLAMFGLRTGGSTYTVLDITDRNDPQLVWEISDPSTYGQSWTKPTVVVSNGAAASTNPSDFTWHMVVGTGEGRTTAGTVIAAYNLGSTSPPSPTTLTLNSTDPAGTRTTAVATSQNDQDRNVDRLYVGTESGDMYRVRVSGLASAWTAARLYDGPSTQPIVAAPLTVLAKNPVYTGSGAGSTGMELAVGVYFGTGRHDQSSDITTIANNSQSIIGIMDPVDTTSDAFNAALTNVTTANLQNQSAATFAVRRDTASGKYLVPTGTVGFYIPLTTGVNLNSNFIEPVGEVVNPPINVRGQILFTTFAPDTVACDIGGLSFFNAVHFQTGGGAVIDYSQNPDAPFFNGGIPDLTGDLLYNSADLTKGITGGELEPLFDTKVRTVDLLNDVTPYQHDGELTIDDIRLHTSNGGILPAVSAVGHTGLPGSPSVLLGAKRVIIPEAYPSDPTSNSGGGENGEVGSTDQMPPPKLLPFNIYNLPMSIISFHEVTSR